MIDFSAGPRQGRVGVAVLSFTNGALFANVWPRNPEIKATLGIANAERRATIAAFPPRIARSGTLTSAAWRVIGYKLLNQAERPTRVA